MKNKLAVCMPVYNAAPFIERSVRSILSQTYNDFIFILTDDCSTDTTVNTIELIQDPRIILFKNKKNMGTIATRNFMLEYCLERKYEYMAIMDADDIAFPERFEKQVKILNNDPSLAVCGSSMKIERTGGIWIARESPSQIKTECLFGNPLPTSTAMIRLRYMEQYNLRWDQSFWPCADYHLWHLMLYHYNLRAQNTGDIDMIYTFSPGGVSHGKGILKQEKKDAKIKQLIFQYFGINANDEDAFSFMKIALYRSNNPEYGSGFLNIAKQILEKNADKKIIDEEGLKRVMSHRASTYIQKTNLPKEIEKQISDALVLKFDHIITRLEYLLIKIKDKFLDYYFPNLSKELVKLYFKIRSSVTDL